MRTRPTSCLDANGLTKEEIMYYCPAVYALAPHESRSDKYLYISSGDLLTVLDQEGIVPTQVIQARTRKEDQVAFTKHLIRLRRKDDLGRAGDIREAVFINSHNGTSSIQMMMGIFRSICSNGQISGEYEQTLRVQHKKGLEVNVVEGTLRIIEEGQNVLDEIEQMKQITLSRPEQLLLAEQAMTFRFDTDDEDDVKDASLASKLFQPEDFLITRRYDDCFDDLYTKMNVIQENMIRPTRRIVRYDERSKVHHLRPVQGIDQNVKINRALWKLAQGMMALKLAQ